MFKKIKTGSPYEEKFSYSRALVVGDWVMTSNTAGRNYATREMSSDAVGQMERAIYNTEAALKAAGAELADIVRARITIPNLDDHMPVMGYWGERMRGIDPVVSISAAPLGAKEYLVELEVTAYKGATDWEREIIAIQ